MKTLIVIEILAFLLLDLKLLKMALKARKEAKELEKQVNHHKQYFI